MISLTFINSMDGMIHVHKTGCKDIAKSRLKMNGEWVISGSDPDSIILEELEGFNYDWGTQHPAHEVFTIFPCCKQRGGNVTEHASCRGMLSSVLADIQTILHKRHPEKKASETRKMINSLSCVQSGKDQWFCEYNGFNIWVKGDCSWAARYSYWIEWFSRETTEEERKMFE